MPITIRPAQLDDTPSMAQLMVDTWLHAHRGQIPQHLWEARKLNWTYEVSERGWRRMIKSIDEDQNPLDRVLLATDQEKIQGLAACSADSDSRTVSVGALYVRPDVQRQQVGSRLFHSIRSMYVQLGFERMEIGVLETNRPARSFYESMGGQMVATRTFDEEGVELPEAVYLWTLSH